MERPQATAEQLIDVDRVGVARFDFVPGGETREVIVPDGTVYRRDKGVEHNVINGGDTPMSFVETELK